MAHRGAIAWLAAAAVAVVTAGAITSLMLQRQPAVTPLPYRFEIPPPMGMSYEGPLAISPDGRQLAFTATDAAGERALWIRAFERLTAQRVEAANGALYPFWSPDGGSVGFFADRKLKIVDVRTGSMRIVCETGTGGGGTWNADGLIVFADESAATMRRPPIGLRRISASGGVATRIPHSETDGEAVQAFPHFLPDGDHYLYMQLEAHESGVYVGRLDADKPKRILPALVTVATPQRIFVNGPVRATHAAGHLFYLDGGALMAQAFDVRRLQLIGDAVRIADEVENLAPGLSSYDVSATGIAVYRPGVPRSRQVSDLPMFDRAAHNTSRFDGASNDQQFSMTVPVKPRAPAPMVVLTNWLSLVKP